VDSQARTCEHCGADLAIAAVLAEREILLARLTSGVPMTPEVLVPRLGEYLVERGKLTPQELEQALEYQRQKSAEGQPILLGQALRELGLIDPEVLDQAITAQILRLQNALSQANRQLEARVRERTLELEQAIAKLGELNQLKANFIANISHELRTPMTPIKGYLELLLSGELGPLDETQMQALKVIRSAAARLEKLIEDLIQFALVSRGQVKLSVSEVDLANLIKSVVRASSPKASMAGVKISLQLDALPPIPCDAEKIAWVVDQLLDNAIKFTPKGGFIKVEARVARNFVKIAVTDSGIGIPPDKRDEIFEPFHQLDGSTRRRYSGTGLGLALSQRLLLAHGTRLQVKSEVGKGSRFEFLLPLAEDGVVQQV
jgi:signal transduction histidine kinase